MNDSQTHLAWFDQQEGRTCERTRRLTFLLLFTREGRPHYWLFALATVAASVLGVSLGAF